jgi:flagellar basal-body rod protein FlgG
MIKSLNTAATGMQAQQTNLDVISNNLANVNTTGFKKSRAEFEDLMYHTIKEPGAATGDNAVSPNGVQTGLGVRTASVQKDFDTGATILTKGPLDLQVEGSGFFQVMTPDGQMAYTRDGSFKKDATGKIVDKNGNTLQPEITIPSTARGIEISQSGEVAVAAEIGGQPQQIGQIELAQFINPTGLKAIGKNLFVPTAASGTAATVRPGLSGSGYVAQGQLEGSNVNIVEEMVNMITAQRAYETNSKAVQAADQMLQSVNTLR